jgi:hypothetical protein
VTSEAQLSANRLNAMKSTGSSEKMGVLSRYEVTLERSLYKALHELQRLQAPRQGQAVPLPNMVDVEVSISGADETHEEVR